jgi:hypothetical protein
MHASALLEVGYKNCSFIPEKAEASPLGKSRYMVTLPEDYKPGPKSTLFCPN